MGTKKYLIEQSINKIKNIVENRINEAPVSGTASASPSPAPVAKPVAQQTPAADPQRDQKISKNIDATMDQAMQVMVGKLPNILSNFAKSSGDKDGVIDAPGVYDNNSQQTPSTQNQTIQEGIVSEITFDEGKFLECMDEGLNEGGLLGLVASAPAILKYGGKAASWTGEKMNSGWLKKWGNKTAKAGEQLHHKYISVIEKALKPFMPNATPEQLHKAADGIFMSGVAILFAGSLANPGMLTSIKGAELGEKSLAVLQKVLPTIGFS